MTLNGKNLLTFQTAFDVLPASLLETLLHSDSRKPKRTTRVLDIYFYMLRSRGTPPPPHCFAILPTNALRGKNLKTEISLVYRIHTDIILRAGTSIYASSGFGPLGPKPCGGNKYLPICTSFNIYVLYRQSPRGSTVNLGLL